MNKIHRKECKSLKEFDKIFRKYLKYFKNNHIYHTYWYTWIWINFIGLEKIKELIPYALNKNCPNLKCIINEVINNYNWSFKHRNGKTYYLQGINISNDDYYYIYVAEDGDVYYSSCVGRFTDVSYYAEK